MAASSGKDALDHAIQAAELYMRAAGGAVNKLDAARFRRKCHELIAYAEQLKAQLANPGRLDRPDILQRSSRLHGNEFPPWENDPADVEFQLQPGQQQYMLAYNDFAFKTYEEPLLLTTWHSDASPFTLSPTQRENFAAWSRPQDMFDLGENNASEGLMRPLQDCNLVQDVTTDCSVVASLSAAIGMLTGKHAVSIGSPRKRP